MTRFTEGTNKPRIKATLKEIKNLIKNQNFQVQETEKGKPVTPLMDVYKVKIQSNGSIDKLKLRIVVRVDLQSREQVGDTW